MKGFLFLLVCCLLAGSLVAVERVPGISVINPLGASSHGRFWGLTATNIDYWDDVNWVHQSKSVVSYDAGGKPDSLFRYSWDETHSLWTNQSVVIFSYVAGQSLVSRAETRNWESGSYLPDWKYEAVYDSQFRLTELRGYSYSSELSDWVCASINNYVYGTGTSFHVNNWVWYNMGNPNLVIYSRSDLQFDAQGRIVQETVQTCPDSVAWCNAEQYNYTYLPADTMTGDDVIAIIANTLLNYYVGNSELVYGNITESLSRIWLADHWQDETRSTRTFNQDLTLLEALEQNWDPAQGDWIHRNRNIYSYDLNGNIHNKLVQDYHAADATWVDHSSYVYTWEQITGDDEHLATPAASLIVNAYPNPFTAALTLSCKTVSAEAVIYDIYNLKGQLVRSLTAAPTTALTWDALDNHGKAQAAGIYFVKATQGTSKATRKFIKLN